MRYCNICKVNAFDEHFHRKEVMQKIRECSCECHGHDDGYVYKCDDCECFYIWIKSLSPEELERGLKNEIKSFRNRESK